jgi:DNA polymerase III delta prime subunit
MKRTNASNSVEETPSNRKALYLSHFTPSMMQPETLQSMLVQRQPLIDACCDDVLHSVSTRAKHHYLFVGPRGIGKTHLISLLHHRFVQAPEVSTHGLVAWMREEEWGVTSFFELILRILRALDIVYPELDIARRREALYELALKQAEAQATSLLLDVMGDKVLVILLENLDDLFDQLGDAGQRRLRGFIQTHPQFVLVATTPSLFAGVSLQKSPFYGFFDIQPLVEFSFDDVVMLLEKIAIERGDRPLAEFIATPQGRARIRAIHHLAEGNPRIYVIFAQFLSREALDELVQAVMHTLDELTPYYQARMKELSGQQRKIVEYLVHFRGAAPVKQIAKSCFITPQTCSGQLKLLREKRYLRSIEVGRESYYELTEPLMRLCMEVKQQRGEPMGLFVKILRIWYTENELNQCLSEDAGSSHLDKRYVAKALELMRFSPDMDPILEIQIKELKSLVSENGERKIKKARQIVEEICHTNPSNEISKQMRIILLLNFSDVFSFVDDYLKKEINESVHFFQMNIEYEISGLKESRAFQVYSLLLKASVSLLRIKEENFDAVVQPLVRLLLKFPSYATLAIFHLKIEKNSNFRQIFLVKIFSQIIDSSKNEGFGGFVEIFQRIGNAVNDWIKTGNDKYLLSLSREERSLAIKLRGNSSIADTEEKLPS